MVMLSSCSPQQVGLLGVGHADDVEARVDPRQCQHLPRQRITQTLVTRPYFSSILLDTWSAVLGVQL
jgi:hypothetical protein